MVSSLGQKEAIVGMENARVYAEKHKKYTRLMYRSVVNDVRTIGIAGSYLEMGAGPGFVAIMLAQQNPDITITAVDLSTEMASVAREYIAENRLEQRIHYSVGDVNDTEMMKGLGKFNFVYSTFSLHHWEMPEDSLSNLWNAVEDGGTLYIYDFKRIGWLCALPLKGGEIKSMRASYRPNEIKAMFQRIGITNYKIKTPFPFLFQAIIARK